VRGLGGCSTIRILGVVPPAYEVLGVLASSEWVVVLHQLVVDRQTGGVEALLASYVVGSRADDLNLVPADSLNLQDVGEVCAAPVDCLLPLCQGLVRHAGHDGRL